MRATHTTPWLTLIMALGAVVPRFAHGACNLLPGTVKSFGSTLGALDRPFAAPGESVEIRLRDCDASPGFLPSGAQQVVTIAYRNPAGAPVQQVALSTDCGMVNTGACGTPTVCHTVAPADLQTVVDPDLGDRRLVVRLPNTDAELGPDGDDVTFSGAAALAVTPLGDPLPCALAATGCGGLGGVRACIDDFFADDGACGSAIPHATFSGFTALPLPNDYQGTCFREDPPCTATETATRLAVDRSGNLLFPATWSGVLVQDGNTPVPRLLRARVKSPLPFDIPDQTFLRSFSPEGV